MPSLIRRACALALLSLAGIAHAAFPEAPVRVVIPFPPGSASDTIARALATAAAARLGQPVLVDNKAGADGIISAQEVARARADGHTLLYGTNSALSASPALKRRLSYDPVQSFAPITSLGRYTFFLFVHPDVQASSVSELVSRARQAPGKLNFATGNTTALVSSLQFNALTGIQMEHVGYKGEPAAVTDLLAGQVQVMFATPALGLPHVQIGKLRLLATTSRNRSSLAPQAPPLVEAGVRDFSITSWAGLFAPAGTPAARLERLRVAFTQALDDASVRSALEKQGFEPVASDAAGLSRLVAEQLVRYRDTIRAAGIEPE